MALITRFNQIKQKYKYSVWVPQVFKGNTNTRSFFQNSPEFNTIINEEQPNTVKKSEKKWKLSSNMWKILKQKQKQKQKPKKNFHHLGISLFLLFLSRLKHIVGLTIYE